MVKIITKDLHKKASTSKYNVQFSKKYEIKINDYEFKVFSQFGEDGIINFLIEKLKIKINFLLNLS